VSKINLRERGIYKLLDGREFVISRSGDGYSLHTARAWSSYGVADYRLHPDGRILSRGVPTCWRVEDLADTARTAEQLAPARPRMF
jgi:hypothetical protein